MCKKKFCLHKEIFYLGLQTTYHKDEPLFLCQCKSCGTTISLSKKQIINIINSIVEAISL